MSENLRNSAVSISLLANLPHIFISMYIYFVFKWCTRQVVEASQDCVPLLVLTADRPHELRDTNANQTIDQVPFT